MTETNPQNRELENGEVTLLLESAKTGCQKSTNELFRLFEDYMLAISNCELDAALRKKVGGSDVVQQAFASAIAGLNEFRGNSSQEFKAWLRKILVNEINQMRRMFRRPGRDVRRERNMEGDSQVAGPIGNLKSPELTPRSDYLRKEQIEIVRKAIQKLPDLDQQVLKLRNWERKSFAEIAAVVGKSEEAVKKTWQRAIVKLDRVMRSDDFSI